MKLFSSLSSQPQKRDNDSDGGGNEPARAPLQSKSKTPTCVSLFVETKWSQPSPYHATLSMSNVQVFNRRRKLFSVYPFLILVAQLEDMVSSVDRNIKQALSDCARKVEVLRLGGSSNLAQGDRRRHKECNPRPSLHLLYTRMLSCVVLPVSSSMWESGVWCTDDYRLLREWCSKCGTYERVTEQQHRTSLEYIESDEGKGALMAVTSAPSHRIVSKKF
jgi:hypothetical protein